MKRFKPKQIGLVAGLLAAVLLTGLAVANWHGQKQVAVTPQPSIPSGGHGKDTAVHAGPSNNQAQAATPTPTSVANPDHPVSSTLAKPTETLNTHSLHLSDSNTMMDSTCNSVVGATCYIQATMGSNAVTVSDTKTVTDATSEGVELIWNANKLSPGSWSIQAVATYNGNTARSDVQTLEVLQ